MNINSNPRRLNCRGAAAIWLVMAIPALLMLAWFGIEMGLATKAVRHAKAASDSIALAAAARYRDGGTAVRTDAQAAAASNLGPNGPIVVTIGNGPAGGGDVEFGHWDHVERVFTVDEDGGPAVRVTVRFAPNHPNGAPSLLLGSFYGTTTMSFQRSSIAVYNPPRHTTSLLLNSALQSALDLSESARFVSKGGVSVRSSNAAACVILSGAKMQLSVLRLPGTLDEQSKSAVDGVFEEGAVIADDPFASVEFPPAIGHGDQVENVEHDNVGVTHVAPGVHGSLEASGGTVILDPGLHQFLSTIVLSGTAILQLDAATIQLMGNATLQVGGSSAVSGTPSTSLNDWSGYWILQQNATLPWSIADSSTVMLAAHCYAPDATLQVLDQAQVSLGTAILGSLVEQGSVNVEFNDVIGALTTTPVPGRARLVR
jgi:Flp pilus assembly protein TadG